jgi:hypothetical protein
MHTQLTSKRKKGPYACSSTSHARPPHRAAAFPQKKKILAAALLESRTRTLVTQRATNQQVHGDFDKQVKQVNR